MAELLLQVRGLSVHYGAIAAVKALDLEVREGERVTLIGANGAGKTSTLKALTGLLPASAGEVRFAGRSVRGTAAHLLARQGLALVPEGRGIFGRMSVLENLHAGAYWRRDRAQVSVEIGQWLQRFPHLGRRAQQAAGVLSGGEQQMLALARALLSRPRLLILDEPSMGLAPVLVEQVFEVLGQVCQGGTALLLVEQNARLALQACQRAYVLDSGRVTLEGPASELLNAPHVRTAYLGE